MKNLVWVLISSVFIAGCFKSTEPCMDVDPALEENAIIIYNSTKGISATKDSNGIFYQVIEPGTGVSPLDASTISVKYKAFLLNGTAVDTTSSVTPFSAPLSNLITGWRYILPKIKEGGHVKIVIPSKFCYGCLGRPPVVPTNAIIYFDIELVDVL